MKRIMTVSVMVLLGLVDAHTRVDYSGSQNTYDQSLYEKGMIKRNIKYKHNREVPSNIDEKHQGSSSYGITADKAAVYQAEANKHSAQIRKGVEMNQDYEKKTKTEKNSSKKHHHSSKKHHHHSKKSHEEKQQDSINVFKMAGDFYDQLTDLAAKKFSEESLHKSSSHNHNNGETGSIVYSNIFHKDGHPNANREWPIPPHDTSKEIKKDETIIVTPPITPTDDTKVDDKKTEEKIPEQPAVVPQPPTEEVTPQVEKKPEEKKQWWKDEDDYPFFTDFHSKN